MKDNYLFSNVYDSALIPAGKLSIPEVFDVKEGRMVNAREFFSQSENELILWRRNLQEEYKVGQARFICPECKQPVKISGHVLARGKVCYFSHFKDSDDCPYKTGIQRTKEEIERQKYALEQESYRHKYLKAAIASALNGEKSQLMGVKNVECEKRITSDIPYLNWRRPDIYAEYKGRKYVFELQLSTTFLSVVVDRDIFYRLNDFNIIWVFNFEDNQDYVNLHNLMCKDIYYANKRNVFIFDAEAEEQSKEKGELVLKCRWLDENNVWTDDEYVTLDMFQYDEETNKPFIIDADKLYLEKHPEYVASRKQLENSREYILKALIERQKQEQKLEAERAEERSRIQHELLNGDKCVECFKSGGKYGYKYGAVEIIPAKYTSAEEISANGYAKVGFNRKIGLIRRDGKEVVPVEYKNVEVIDGRHGIVMAFNKEIDLWLGDECISVLDEYDSQKNKVIKDVKDHMTIYGLKKSVYWVDTYSELFSIIYANDSCLIIVYKKVYHLSENRLTQINGKYSDIQLTSISNVFIAKNADNNLWGVIDSSGRTLIDSKYLSLTPTESEYLIARISNNPVLSCVIDYNGKLFVEPKYNALLFLNDHRFAFCKGDLWGVCDNMGNVLHEPEYTYIRAVSFDKVMASISKSDSIKWKVYNNIPTYDAEQINLCVLDERGDIAFTEQIIGKYRIRHSGDLYSIILSEDRELFSYELSFVHFVDNTNAIIRNSKGVAGFLRDETSVFYPGCEFIELLCENTFKFSNNIKCTIGDYSGPRGEYGYSNIKVIDSSHFLATKVDYHCLRYVIIDGNGRVLSSEFSQIDEFEDGFANAVFNGEKGLIDINGKMQENVVEKYGEYQLCFSFGNFYFRNNDSAIISNTYESVNQLHGTYFSVKKKSETGFRLYSLDLNKTADKSFSHLNHLVDNLVVARASNYDGGYFWLYRDLEQLLPEGYSSISLLDNGYIALKKSVMSGFKVETKWEIAGKDGIKLNDRKYDSIIEANRDSFKVSYCGQIGVIDLNGNPLVERVTCENGMILTHCFDEVGLEDTSGKVIVSLDDHMKSIEFIGDARIKACKNGGYALYTMDGNAVTEHKFSSIIYESEDRYAVIEDNIKGHIDSHGNYVETSAVPIAEHGVVIFVIREKFGLRGLDGGIIIPAQHSDIKYLTRGLFSVNKHPDVVMYDAKGSRLTSTKYSKIVCEADGSIKASRPGGIGYLDDNGNEIINEQYFKGGCLKSSFGAYFITDEAGEIIVPQGYSKIEILDEDGLLALWKKNKCAIWNSGKVSDFIYDSARYLGNDFILASRTISKKIRKRITGYGFKGNPYTYYGTDFIEEKWYGVIDRSFQMILPFKFASISDFDADQNIITTDSSHKEKSISLLALKKYASEAFTMSVDTEYRVELKRKLPIGLVVEIQKQTFVIHKKYLFKDKNDFMKGEAFIAKYKGKDIRDYPIWETRAIHECLEYKMP
ncbi:MAG: WG repeat-containing protein [Bacteroidales bacterium]|nr:WG repeat-containing protein [Bacteroidales bacterium]